MKIESKVVVSDVLRILYAKCKRNEGLLQALINYANNDSSEESKNRLRKMVSEVYDKLDYKDSLPISDLRFMLRKMTSENDDLEGFSNDDILKFAMVLQMIVLGQSYSENCIESISEIAFIYVYIVFIIAELNMVYDGSLSKGDLSQSWIVELCSALSKRRDRKKNK